MKIIEALKELPLIDKKIESNVKQLREYSSDLQQGEVESFAFGDTKKQKAEVASIVQSTEDLVKRKQLISRALALTNAQTVVAIDGEQKTITEWISFRDSGIAALQKAYSALCDNNGGSKIQRTQVDPVAGVRVVRFYDEKSRNEKLVELENKRVKIDTTLETINATTDLAVAV